MSGGGFGIAGHQNTFSGALVGNWNEDRSAFGKEPPKFTATSLANDSFTNPKKFSTEGMGPDKKQTEMKRDYNYIFPHGPPSQTDEDRFQTTNELTMTAKVPTKKFLKAKAGSITDTAPNRSDLIRKKMRDDYNTKNSSQFLSTAKISF
eukprot:TRINITY_DN774115_c0_g1_i1.p1 TRINITY_DN774115_c0_g1~~TRINITY_DN774115_c0_g1_i1.p1  ORF type:complete len:149 (+),score=33.90 TRINITY_DN774115_c0_g1_i1:51-497(+)